MKKTLSLCLLFCLLAASASFPGAAGSRAGLPAPLQASTLQPQFLVPMVPDSWALESSDDELPGGVERRAFVVGATLPEWSGFTCPLQPGALSRSPRPQGITYHPALYTLHRSYRI